eukprot:TRINITY_DN17531_c0_g1_i1.p1 TRINITY_DN17531_c0_g1~~TRINITY_DN17531_c0_g1_i1.p1  ORF type:complete len:293 (-),score=70.14 TRINITY_DN17531_c0_g1_i1:92-970(-)
MPDATPVSSLLRTLTCSGSGAFSKRQLRSVLDLVSPPGAPRRQVVVVDLRKESHGFLEGAPVSWFRPPYNWGNRGLTAAQAIAACEESVRALRHEADAAAAAARLRRRFKLVLREIVKLPRGGGVLMTREVAPPAADRPVLVQGERAVVEAAGAVYVPLPTDDHSVPDAQVTRWFVDLCCGRLPGVKLERGAHVHVHCRAGRGRTTLFMLLLHMLQLASCSGGGTSDDAAARALAPGALSELARLHVRYGGKDLLAPAGPLDCLLRGQFRARVAFLQRFRLFATGTAGGLSK